MATGDMLLVVEGITGESRDTVHPGAIDVVSWSWGLQATTDVGTGQPRGRRKLNELEIIKQVDQASPILMQFLSRNTGIKKAELFVRKAGTEALEYFVVELKDARVTFVKIDSRDEKLVEQVRFSFVKITVTYRVQSSTGARLTGDKVFTDDAHGPD